MFYILYENTNTSQKNTTPPIFKNRRGLVSNGGQKVMTQKFNEKALDEKMSELYENAIEEYVEENNTEENFERELNDAYGTVSICGSEFIQGTAYKELDPIGFRCALADNEDSVREQAEQYISEDDFRDEALEALDMEDEQ